MNEAPQKSVQIVQFEGTDYEGVSELSLSKVPPVFVRATYNEGFIVSATHEIFKIFTQARFDKVQLLCPLNTNSGDTLLDSCEKFTLMKA